MEKFFLKKFADLIIEFVGLKKGQNLLIKTEPIHLSFCEILVARAYEKGARYCKIDLDLPHLVDARVKYSAPNYLDYIPDLEIDAHNEYVKNDWATVFIKGEEDPDLPHENSLEKKGKITKRYFESVSKYQLARLENKISWLIVVLPTAKWASKVLNIDPSKEAVRLMWEKLIPIYKLDKPDPIKSWKDQSTHLTSICNQLNDKSFKSIVFKGPGTDLELHFSSKSKWITSKSKSANGSVFYGNLPVEVFNTPDFRKTEGIVTITRPVMVLSKYVKNAVFEFKNGKIVSYDAKHGKEALDELFNLDPSTKYVGEAALIDINSPNYKSNLIFHNVLLDEGASSHIALGGGIPPCISGANGLTSEQKTAEGINVSDFHIDFMIGSSKIDVFGRDDTGDLAKIMEQGRYCEPYSLTSIVT